MKKKYVIVGITCIFLLISGICYSCAFRGSNTSAVLVTSISEKSKQAKQKTQQEQTSLATNLASTVTDKTKVIDLETTDPEYEIQKDAESGNSDNDANATTDKASNTIYIHICGSVKKPGVYKVSPGSRVFDLIELAGGLEKDAAGDYINQAQIVSDGQRIYIPNESEVQEINPEELLTEVTASVSAEKETKEKININTADATDLMNLPGIGQAKADSIMEYRKTNGKFKTIEELMNIPGIKEGLFRQISAYIKV